MPVYPPFTAPSLYSSHHGLMTPAGLATQVPLESFFDHVLPPLQRGLNVSEIVTNMRTVTEKTKCCMPITQRGRRRGFPVDPAMSTRSEETSFLNLKRAVSDAIKNAVRTGCTLTPGLEFHGNARCVMHSAARTTTSLPDSYFLRHGAHTWSNIGVFGEYKKAGTEADISDVSIFISFASRS